MTRRARASLCAEPREVVRIARHHTAIHVGYDAAIPRVWAERLSERQMVAITAVVAGLVVAGLVR